MARVNVSIPDDLHRAARAAGLNVSGLAQRAILDELDRREKVAALDAHLARLDAELGPIPADELAEAEAWAEGVYGPSSATAPRSA